MPESFKHKEIYGTNQIYQILLSSVGVTIPSGVCLQIAEFADNTFVYAVENCIFPCCASYARYRVKKRTCYVQQMKDTLDDRFYIISRNDNGLNCTEFMKIMKSVGGKGHSKCSAKQRNYKLIDLFDGICIIGYEEWIDNNTYYYYLTPIFVSNNNENKKNPILFIHAHVMMPFDVKTEFTKKISKDLKQWEENHYVDEQVIKRWLICNDKPEPNVNENKLLLRLQEVEIKNAKLQLLINQLLDTQSQETEKKQANDIETTTIKSNLVRIADKMMNLI